MTALIGAAAVVLWAVSAYAQAKPSFAGTWVREMPAAPAAGAPPGGGGGRGGGGGGGGWGMEPTITQDGTTLTVKWMQAGRGGAEPTPQQRTYKLDGTDSSNMVMGRGGEAAPVISKAAWDGAKLVIKTTTANGEQSMAVSLEAGKLTIATTNPGREGGAPTTNTITYAKK